MQIPPEHLPEMSAASIPASFPHPPDSNNNHTNNPYELPSHSKKCHKAHYHFKNMLFFFKTNENMKRMFPKNKSDLPAEILTASAPAHRQKPMHASLHPTITYMLLLHKNIGDIIKQNQYHQSHKEHQADKMYHALFFGGYGLAPYNLYQQKYQSSAVQCRQGQ